MLHTKLKGIMNAEHGSKYFTRRSPPPQRPNGMGSIGQNSTFLQHGPVAYQVKGNHECSNMVAKNLPVNSPMPLTGQ